MQTSTPPLLMILAGGASSRMWPLREKSLIRFGGDTLLVMQLHRYTMLGFTQAIIVGNPENHSAIEVLVSQVPAMQIEVVVQPEAKGMGDALLQGALALRGDLSRPLYITQVHDVVDDALHTAMLSAYRNNPTATYLAAYEMDDYFPGGYLAVDASGRIQQIVEKPAPDQRPSNLVNIVAHIHPDAARLFNTIRAQYDAQISSDDHYERAMAALMPEHPFYVVPYKGHWSALKYPWHTLDVMNYYLSKLQGQTIAPDAFISDKATISGNVYIGAGAKVFPGAAVVGPAYIGAGTIVGNNALVRASMVLEKCEVGFTTEVARSYVAEHCAMHACRVLDSVFAPHVNFSAGCTTANLRIDRGIVSSTVKGNKLATGRDKFGAIIGTGAFLAVDVMTMPGIKVGERAQVGPGTHVQQDLANDARLYVKQAQVLVEG
jgi:UDP-N-acetylglucosamine diphosphorylase / glucose-1-phosphate thymidylyltransferase / UDP-N-acetylgalactosamine diphosphorylase / glucosamine-1-phosphate N-acetyltransferase / galactosamine-1-phosphate N-acetyltransferase